MAQICNIKYYFNWSTMYIYIYNMLAWSTMYTCVMYDSYLLKDVHSVLVNFPREYAQESMIILMMFTCCP